MADEAFALSPISARAAQPREEDYAAISEAFMETSRGRWFLTEYAKRNRNADTSMVLDAVARIEQSLAAQKEESLHQEESLRSKESLAAQQQAAAAEADTRLQEAWAAIRGAVETAQAQAAEALDGLALEHKLAPVRKGARVIREIAWRLREIGNDGRICDLIDSQVSVIEAGVEQISSVEAKVALDAAFVSMAGRLAEFGGDAPAALADGAGAPPAPAALEMPPEAVAGTVEVAPAKQATEASATSAAAEAELAEAEAALAQTEATAEIAEITDETADAHDEALLDMIAMEMGAPDAFDGDEMAEPETAETHFAEPAPAEIEVAAQAPEPVMVAAPVELPPQPAPQPLPEPAAEISLGSSIIASGLVRRPVAANDPLAPIRRMSQAEKIAFFS